MLAGRIGDLGPNGLVLAVHAHSELIAVVRLPVFLSPAGIGVFLPPPRWLPVSWSALHLGVHRLQFGAHGTTGGGVMGEYCGHSSGNRAK